MKAVSRGGRRGRGGPQPPEQEQNEKKAASRQDRKGRQASNHPKKKGHSLAEASINGDLVMTAQELRSNLIRTIEGTRRCSQSYIENFAIEDDSKLAGRHGAGAGGQR